MAEQRPQREKIAMASAQVMRGNVSTRTAQSVPTRTATRSKKPVPSGNTFRLASSSGVPAPKVSRPGSASVSMVSQVPRTAASAGSTRNGVPTRSTSVSKLSASVKAPAVTSKTASVSPAPDGQVASSIDLYNASQVYSWAYMTSTLDDSRRSTEKSVLTQLEARSKELDAEELQIGDTRSRYESEQLLEFYGEVSGKEWTHALQSLTELYLKHEAASENAISWVMNCVDAPRRSPGVLQECNGLLACLNKLLEEATQIEAEILRLRSSFEQEGSKAHSALTRLSSVVQSRIATLSEAFLVAQSHKDIVRLELEAQTLSRINMRDV